MKKIIYIFIALLFFTLNFGQSITLTWNANTETDLAGYTMYRSDTTGTGYIKITTSLLQGTQYVDQTIDYGKTYYYVLTASNTSGLESDFSNEAFGIVMNVQPPAAPSGLQITVQQSFNDETIRVIYEEIKRPDKNRRTTDRP